MSRTAALLVLLLAIISGVIASATVLKYVKQAKPAVTQDPMAPVVIAKVEIPASTAIRTDQIEISQRSPKTIPEGAIVSKEAALGRVTRATIYPGEIVLGNRLAEPGSPDGLPALIPKGFRAISLRVDASTSVAGFIFPGHYIDILTTIKMPDSQRDTITKVILQNIKVLATGHEIERGADDKEKDKSQAKIVPTVTVLVTLEQAERLALAVSAGDVELVLRNRTDQAQEETAGVSLASLIPQANKDIETQRAVATQVPAPAEPTPRPVRTVQLYRGAEKTEMTFKY
jgi:pilus assembly protein CpaB